MGEMRKCIDCDEWKETDCFKPHNTSKDGLEKRCGECSDKARRVRGKKRKYAGGKCWSTYGLILCILVETHRIFFSSSYRTLWRALNLTAVGSVLYVYTY
jgi:hypothetical protein